MISRFVFCTVILSFALSIAQAQENRVAVAHLMSENVTGTVLFTETADGLLVNGIITGMPAGHYGFHIHELGDTSTCLATGGHFNPDETNHGGRDHSVRHVGDLGNAYFSGDVNAISNFSFVDASIALRGRNNILGRSVVLHAEEDDLGLGGTPDSLTTGNAGARVACAVIGMHAPVKAWEYSSSAMVLPSFTLLILATLFRVITNNQ